MKNLNIISILAAILLAAAASSDMMAQDGFVSGMEGEFTFSAAKCGSAGKSTSLTISGRTFKIITFYYNGSTVTAIEDASGKRNILFMDGKPNMPTSTSSVYPRIGFSGDSENKTNEYTIGPHDFTDDGQPELVIAVRSASGDGFAAYIFSYMSGAWKCIGEMVSTGHGIRACRVFRQTMTLKGSSSGVLYTWTCHDGHFDFLSSDHVNDPSVLY